MSLSVSLTCSINTYAVLSTQLHVLSCFHKCTVVPTIYQLSYKATYTKGFKINFNLVNLFPISNFLRKSASMLRKLILYSIILETNYFATVTESAASLVAYATKRECCII